MTNPEQRVMIVGLGRMGLAHAAIICHVPNASIVAVVDRDAGLGKMAASMGLKAPFYRDALEAAKTEQPTVAYVCTPTFTHRELVEQLAPLGIHLFVEKPLGHTLESSLAMAKAAAKHGVRTAVGYNLAHERTFVRARQLLDEGAIGKVTRYEAMAYHSEVFEAREGWLFDPKRSGGGAAANIGTHVLYYAMSCFGFPTDLDARCERLYSEHVEDDARAKLRHDNDIEGDVHICWSLPGKPILECRMRVFGERGELSVGRQAIQLTLNEAWSDLPAGEHRIHAADTPSAVAYDFSPEYGGEGYYCEGAAFLTSCLHDASYSMSNAFAPDFVDGVAVERILEAIYHSSEAGGETVVLDQP